MADTRRLRILYVKEFFEENTDENRTASIPDVINYLKRYGIEADRRSILEDIEALNLYKDIEIQPDKNGRNRKLLGREFELAEVSVLIDFVLASKSLSAETSKTIIEKIEKFVSKHQRRELERYLKESVFLKSKNQSVLYYISIILGAIKNYNYIEFQYFQYNMKKERELQENGKVYHVRPEKLYYDNGFYYLQDSESGEKKTFRLDKMTNLHEVDWRLADERYGFYQRKEIIEPQKRKVKILFYKTMMDTVIDRFGEDVHVEIVNDEFFRIEVTIIPDQQFFGWIFELGEDAMIEYPLEVAAQMMDMLHDGYKSYKESHSRNIYYYCHKNKKPYHQTMI